MKDLSEQNEVLVTTVEELEREANERVSVLEDKLQKATVSVKVSDSWTKNVAMCVGQLILVQLYLRRKSLSR